MLARLEEIFQRGIYHGFSEAIRQAEDEAESIAKEWGRKYYCTTYRATCRNGGAHRTCRRQIIDFNRDLCRPIEECLIAVWEKSIGEDIPNSIGSSMNEMAAHMETYSQTIEEVFGANSVKKNEIELFLKQMQVFENEAKGIMSKLKDLLNSHQRNANRQLLPSTKESMASIYQECADIKGKGTFQHLKVTIEDYVKTHKKEMFTKATAAVRMKLQGMIVGMREHLEKELRNLSNSIQNHVDIFIGDDRSEESNVSAEELSSMRTAVWKALNGSGNIMRSILEEEEQEKRDLQERHEDDVSGSGSGDADDDEDGDSSLSSKSDMEVDREE